MSQPVSQSSEIESLRSRVEDLCPDADAMTREMLISARVRDQESHPLATIRSWLQERNQATTFRVLQVPLAELEGWHFDAQKNLRHHTGKFFSVEGAEISVTGDGRDRTWRQPMIHQPEVGILGILAQKRGGVLSFLLQAKIEPGNVNGVQLSPTVQATRSNYTQVHGGALPPYLGWFLDTRQGTILVDQLQSEQGARFLKKRNRNIILVLPEDREVEAHPQFCWLTLGQIKALLRENNVINMDTRTVLACTQYKRGDADD